ncbi:GMC family oxidoreductase [Thalassotalea litorea]|uniref:GMC family oxidoreductase n=1 Tax=Thalassotalea litorea TaxID=2020715 RepID=UPI0037365516
MKYDACIVGSGAGASPVAYTLAKAGYKVVVLEKGPWLDEKDFYKDELACCRRTTYSPKLEDEPHVIEEEYENDAGISYWQGESTAESGWDFWNGSMVGGSSNLMSGYFHRLKPVDFRLKSEFGAIKGANVEDWPISYDELEPFYDQVDREVGVSGKVVEHPHLEPHKSDYPFPPTAEHPISAWIDKAATEIGYHPIPVPRAVLSKPAMGRRSCEYSGFCSSYGCSSGAKGSGRAALLNHAVATGNCKIIPNAKVFKLDSQMQKSGTGSDSEPSVTGVHYYDRNGRKKSITARKYIVACQAIETSRLLLASKSDAFPNGLANNHGQVGKNIIFSAGGTGRGDFMFDEVSKEQQDLLRVRGPFINRAVQDFYEIDDKSFGDRSKGGTIDFLFHQNAIAKASGEQWDEDDNLVWGDALKERLLNAFNYGQTLRFEVFNDWLPTDDCFVELDNEVTDKWGDPVAKVRIGAHQHDLKVGEYLAAKAENVLKAMGATNVYSSVSSYPPPNLQAGGCRFGDDPNTSVLDKNCCAHEVKNLYVTDGSFMPSGGSVPYTYTIYANAFRVAKHIEKELSNA